MNDKNYFVADFETVTENTKYYQENNRTDVLFGVFKDIKGTITEKFITIYQFFKLLKKHTKTKNGIIFFHNLGFDGSFILDYLDANGFIASSLGDKRDKTFNVFRSTSQKIYSIDVNMDGYHFKFRCSKLLLSSKVEDLGKNVNLDKYKNLDQKMDENFYNVEPSSNMDLNDFINENKEFCEYCERDVEIVRLSLHEFFTELYDFLAKNNKLDEFENIINKPTISSISFYLQNIFLPEYKGKNPLYLYDFEEKMIADKFKQGGLTLINKMWTENNIEINEDGYIIDLKSAYPAAMNYEKCGYKLVSSYQNKTYEEVINSYNNNKDNYEYYIEAYVYNATPKNHKIPLLKNFSDKKMTPYFLKCKKYHCFYEFDEFRTLFSHLFNYDDIEIKNIYVVQKRYLFPKFIQDLYNKKEEHKENKKLAKSHMFKILLNSGYGVHCKKWDYVSVSFVEPKEPIMQIGKKKMLHKPNIDLNKKSHLCYLKNNKFFAYKPIDPSEQSNFSNTWIANSITSNIRKQLLDAIIYFEPQNVIYTDTDSLFLINVDYEKIKNYCGEELGDWEIEKKSFNEFFIKRSKLYQLKKDGENIKRGSAGFKELPDLKDIKNGNTFKSGLIPKRVDGGLILIPLEKSISQINYEYEIDENEIKKDYFDKLDNEISKVEKYYLKNMENKNEIH